MKVITKEQAEAVLSYSPLLGTFVYRRGQRAGQLISNKTEQGYAVVRINGVQHLAHRVAWLIATGEMPQGFIDHINGDRADNRISNLRVVDVTLNNQNRCTPQRDNKTSKFLGVSGWSRWPGKFRAQIKVMGKKIHLGVFDSEEEAAAAYIAAKRRLHAGFVEERFA